MLVLFYVSLIWSCLINYRTRHNRLLTFKSSITSYLLSLGNLCHRYDKVFPLKYSDTFLKKNNLSLKKKHLYPHYLCPNFSLTWKSSVTENSMVVGLRIRKIKDFKGIEVVFFSRRKTGKCLEYTLFIKTDNIKLKICICLPSTSEKSAGLFGQHSCAFSWLWLVLT